jgi:hypothetical protein
VKKARPPATAGTLQVVLTRTFALLRQTRLERLSSLTVEIPDERGQRWQVKFTRVKVKR